ncbi:MAG: hypothetical protein EA408_11705 [Marinilabiliales bacterium]|nr:MAG: hypothetical protein EA408_11705 [Marinilabiliales bacterium]
MPVSYWLIAGLILMQQLIAAPVIFGSGQHHAGMDPEIELIASHTAPSSHFYTDHLENIYFIDGHRIIRINAATGRRVEYSPLPTSPVTSADVSNPMQLLLFYRDFNFARFLDNNLTPLRPALNFSELGIEQALLACTSGRGGLWVFSDREHRLVYFDQQLRNTHRSIIISNITGGGEKPVYMTESQNRLFLHIPRKGILVFDRYASYLRTVPYDGPVRFQVSGNRIIWFGEGGMAVMNIETGEKGKLELPGEIVADDARLQPDRLYVLSEGRIHVYRFR